MILIDDQRMMRLPLNLGGFSVNVVITLAASQHLDGFAHNSNGLVIEDESPAVFPSFGPR
jgi:hypothetical protein